MISRGIPATKRRLEGSSAEYNVRETLSREESGIPVVEMTVTGTAGSTSPAIPIGM